MLLEGGLCDGGLCDGGLCDGGLCEGGLCDALLSFWAKTPRLVGGARPVSAIEWADTPKLVPPRCELRANQK